jgi:hypothetical protein
LLKKLAGDQTVADVAGHVSRQMLSRYSHIRMEDNAQALDAIVSKPAPVPRPAATGEQKALTPPV